MDIGVGILDNEKYKDSEISNYEATIFLYCQGERKVHLIMFLFCVYRKTHLLNMLRKLIFHLPLIEK